VAVKARYKFPFAKANRLYRSGLIAAKQRAAQQSDSAIEKAAGELIDLIDKPKSVAGRPERKAFVFEYKFVKGAAPGTIEGYGSVFNNEDADPARRLRRRDCASPGQKHGTSPRRA
jgi:hypothetical protein